MKALLPWMCLLLSLRLGLGVGGGDPVAGPAAGDAGGSIPPGRETRVGSKGLGESTSGV